VDLHQRSKAGKDEFMSAGMIDFFRALARVTFDAGWLELAFIAVNGRQVKAGAVLGFMGNTGDASTTPYHLHFEIHPVGMLYLGYDGAVNPTAYLMAWKHLQDVDFAQVAGWAPPVSPTSSAPKPGAILLSQTDISTADGLDPGSLQRALKQAAKQSNRG
jgi:hypothetical protein